MEIFRCSDILAAYIPKLKTEKLQSVTVGAYKRVRKYKEQGLWMHFSVKKL